MSERAGGAGAGGRAGGGGIGGGVGAGGRPSPVSRIKAISNATACCTSAQLPPRSSRRPMRSPRRVSSSTSHASAARVTLAITLSGRASGGTCASRNTAAATGSPVQAESLLLHASSSKLGGGELSCPRACGASDADSSTSATPTRERRGNMRAGLAVVWPGSNRCRIGIRLPELVGGSLSEYARASLPRWMSASGVGLWALLFRLGSLLGFGALAASACAVDDRQLSDVDLRGSGGMAGSGGQALECDAEGANACETCLSADCCTEARACVAGSRCVEYLQCAAACNSDEPCLNACAADSPTGFGSALALGVCSQTKCAVCSGGSPPFEACDETGTGSCENAGDCGALRSNALAELDVAGCAACDPDLLAPACARCLSAASGLSVSCSSCVASWLSCAVRSCAYACQGSAGQDACEPCLTNAGCNAELAACGFTR